MAIRQAIQQGARDAMPLSTFLITALVLTLLYLWRTGLIGAVKPPPGSPGTKLPPPPQTGKEKLKGSVK